MCGGCCWDCFRGGDDSLEGGEGARDAPGALRTVRTVRTVSAGSCMRAPGSEPATAVRGLANPQPGRVAVRPEAGGRPFRRVLQP